MLRGVHHPARYRDLERIRRLDPEQDHDEVLRITARLEFPWDYTQGGRLLRLAPPRRTPYRHRATTYLHGHRPADLGPASMLDQLDRTCPAPAPHDEGATA